MARTNTRTFVLAAAGAVAVLVVVGWLLLSGGDGVEPVDEPDAVTTTTVEPTVSGEAFRWEVPGIMLNDEQIALEADAPDGSATRTYVGGRLVDDLESSGDRLSDWDTSVDPAVPAPVADIDAIVSETILPATCIELDLASEGFAPGQRDTEEGLALAAAFVQYATLTAVELGCTAGNWGPELSPPPIVGPVVGDRALLESAALAAAEQVGEPILSDVIEEALGDGLLDFSGPDVTEAAANIVEFSTRLDQSYPALATLELFVDPEGPVWDDYANSTTFGSDGGLFIGEGSFTLENFVGVSQRDLSPAESALLGDNEDAVLVEYELSAPSLSIQDRQSVVQVATIPAREGESILLVLVPSETGWRIWAEA